MDLVQLITAADSKYLPYLCCHLVSLGDHVGQTGRIQVHIVHRGISESERNTIEQCVSAALCLHWLEPTMQLLKDIGAPLKFATASPHYFRLLAPYLLPSTQRSIYLDADTIVLDSLDPLWAVELDGNSVGAVRDYLPSIADGIANWRDLGLNPDAPYFNSGVLVMDLNQWRAYDVALQTLEVCSTHAGQLLAQQKWPQFDQYGLNVVLHGRWKSLDRAWNHGADLPQPSATKARIVHYVGNGKAGLPTCQALYNDAFFELLNRTPFRLSSLPETLEISRTP